MEREVTQPERFRKGDGGLFFLSPVVLLVGSLLWAAMLVAIRVELVKDARPEDADGRLWKWATRG